MQVVVLGGGYAGLAVARRLESALPEDVSLIVVDQSDAHLVQHELHRVIRRPSIADRITVPLESVLDRADHEQDRVSSLDPDAGVAELGGGELAFDYGALCLGARTAFYDLPGLTEHAQPLKTLEHARDIRDAALSTIEASGRLVVGGAGLAGVQVAGELHALATAEGARDAVDIVLLEQRESVAPTFPDPFQRAVREELEHRDIDIRTGTTVRGADESAVLLADGTLPYDQFVWTGGIRGSDAMDGHRPEVRANLRLGERTVVAGDAARVVDRNGEIVPPSAQTAIGQARVAATNVSRLIEANRDAPAMFEPRLDQYVADPVGWIVSVGDGAVAQVGPTVLRGRAALALKTSVGIGHLSSVGAVREAAAFAVQEFGPD